jgi:hypothetical protein
MSNSSRQPVVEKAVGSPIKGKPASTIARVDKTGNRLDTKPIEDTKSDES